MFNDEEWLLIWFDYNDINFIKAEQFLAKIDRIESVFDKNKLKNAIFENIKLSEIKEKLLNVDFEMFKENVLNEFYKHNLTAITFLSKHSIL